MLRANSRINKFLTSLGLSDTERQLYLIGLDLTEATVSDLIRKTTINRTTAYHALGTLQQKGLATEVKVQGKLVYSMAEPQKLSTLLDRQKVEIDNQKLELESITHLFPLPSVGPTETTSVEKFEGLEGVKEAVEKALYSKERHWEIIAPRNNFFSQVDKSYADYFMDRRKSRGIHARTLWEKPLGPLPSLGLNDLLIRKPRYLPESFRNRFKSVIIIFDNKALFITSAEKEAAILVESEEITETLKVLFEALWQLSEKPA
jgi:sugar-specific transcriptional regulator TrmB